MTPEQCRAARALLDWTQHDLAGAAGVAFSTVGNFEGRKVGTFPHSIEAMRGALERAGIAFLDRDGLVGVALRDRSAP